MDFTCDFCGKKFSNKGGLNSHIMWCASNPNRKTQGNNSDLEDLSQEDKDLLRHYTYLYPDKYNFYYEQFKQQYANSNYKKYDISKLAKKDTLDKLIELDEQIQINQGTWSCPICGLHIIDMGSHVKKIHHLNWEDFVITYSWQGSKIFFSDQYRKNLSDNKIHFYNDTSEGLQLRQIQSILYSGDNNPSKRDDVKLKISKSRRGHHLSIRGKEAVSKSTDGGVYSESSLSYGYIFWQIYDGKEIRFRSKTEYLIFLMLNYHNIDFEYEPFKVEYFDDKVQYNRHYIVDFVSDGRMFEVKPTIEDFFNDYKYEIVQQVLKKVNKKLEIITPYTFYNTFEVEENLQKPLSFFENTIKSNILNGICKIQLPHMHEKEFYLNSKFMKSLGNDPIKILEAGEILYENKKNSGNYQ